MNKKRIKTINTVAQKLIPIGLGMWIFDIHTAQEQAKANQLME